MGNINEYRHTFDRRTSLPVGYAHETRTLDVQDFTLGPMKPIARVEHIFKGNKAVALTVDSSYKGWYDMLDFICDQPLKLTISPTTIHTVTWEDRLFLDGLKEQMDNTKFLGMIVLCSLY